jgi:hypothetical protein
MTGVSVGCLVKSARIEDVLRKNPVAHFIYPHSAYNRVNSYWYWRVAKLRPLEQSFEAKELKLIGASFKQDFISNPLNLRPLPDGTFVKAGLIHGHINKTGCSQYYQTGS